MAFSVGEHDDDAPMSDINVTPLVDVMLVLMIVFMITMPVLTHSVQIQLPTTSDVKQEEAKKETKPLEISVDSSGQYVIGAESTTVLDLNAVKKQLAQIAKEDPETVVAIDADKEAQYDSVAKLLEAAKDAGLRKVGFRMEVKQTAQ